MIFLKIIIGTCKHTSTCRQANLNTNIHVLYIQYSEIITEIHVHNVSRKISILHVLQDIQATLQKFTVAGSTHSSLPPYTHLADQSTHCYGVKISNLIVVSQYVRFMHMTHRRLSTSYARIYTPFVCDSITDPLLFSQDIASAHA